MLELFDWMGFFPSFYYYSTEQVWWPIIRRLFSKNKYLLLISCKVLSCDNNFSYLPKAMSFALVTWAFANTLNRCCLECAVHFFTYYSSVELHKPNGTKLGRDVCSFGRRDSNLHTIEVWEANKKLYSTIILRYQK